MSSDAWLICILGCFLLYGSLRLLLRHLHIWLLPLLFGRRLFLSRFLFVSIGEAASARTREINRIIRIVALIFNILLLSQVPVFRFGDRLSGTAFLYAL